MWRLSEAHIVSREIPPLAVKELRRATDLALRATKHTARAVGRSMAGLLTAEHHLWLNLTEIREKEKAFLLDAPISSSGLFGDVVNTIVDKFKAVKTQSAAFKQFMLRCAHEPASASSSREHPAHRKEPVGRGNDPIHPPPYTVWGAHGHSASRTCMDLPVVSPWVLPTIQFGYTLNLLTTPPVSTTFFLLLWTAPTRLL